MALTNKQITAAKSRAKPYKMADGDNLYLVVQPTGAKVWRMNYRHLGKQKTLYVGAWPEIDIAAAREIRIDARARLADGIDPGAEKRAAKLAAMMATDNSFKGIAEEWFAKIEREGRAPATLEKTRWLLKKAYPLIGSLPVDKITPQESLAVLRKIEATGRYESARRMRSVLSRVFRYAIATARAERDAASDLRGAITTPKTRHHAAITTPKEAGVLLRAIEGFVGQQVTGYALRLSPHLFVRPGELRQAEWSEFDSEAAVWSLPAEKTKMRRPHQVPLSRQVIELLNQLHKLTNYSRYVFPCVSAPRRCMSENTINAALRRMGYSKTEMTAHGFRAMAATLLNEMGIWNPNVIEKQLAHLDDSMVRRAYTRAEYWDERVRMMQHWSDYLDQLREDATTEPPAVSQWGRRAT